MIGKRIWMGLAAVLAGVSSLTVAAAPDTAAEGIEGARLMGSLKLDGELFHVQGLELDKERIWVTSVDRAENRGYLHEFDRKTGRFIQRLELTDGARYHPGGMSMSGRSIWVPVAEMRPDSSAVLVEIDADTFEVRRKIAVADHLGCVAVKDGKLVAGNWDSRLFYVFDVASKKQVRVVPNPSQTSFQDMKFVGNQLVAGGTLNWWSGTIDWIDWPSMKLHRSVKAGAVNPVRSYTGEGMTIEGRELYLLPEDGPSRLFHFTLGA